MQHWNLKFYFKCTSKIHGSDSVHTCRYVYNVDKEPLRMIFEVSKHPIKINALYLEFPHLHSFLFSCINGSLVGVFSVEVHITFLLIMWESGLPGWWNLFHQRWLYFLFSAIIIFNFNLSVMLDTYCIFFTIIGIFFLS